MKPYIQVLLSLLVFTLLVLVFVYAMVVPEGPSEHSKRIARCNSWIGREVNIGLGDKGIIEGIQGVESFIVRYKKEKTKSSLLSASASLISGNCNETYGTMLVNCEVVFKHNPEQTTP